MRTKPESDPLTKSIVQLLKSRNDWVETPEIVWECGKSLQTTRNRVWKALQGMQRRGVVDKYLIKDRGSRPTTVWILTRRASMTLTEAQEAILHGSEFGSVFERVAETDQTALKGWYVITVEVPNLKARVKEKKPDKVLIPAGMGYTGSVCVSCQGLRMVRTGTCERCDDCGATTGCV